MLPSRGFELPQLFSWVDNLKENSKNVSITSMECIHAVQGVPRVAPSPTTFFYRRKIENQEKIEDGLKWIFDFEYVPMDAELKGSLHT